MFEYLKNVVLTNLEPNLTFFAIDGELQEMSCPFWNLLFATVGVCSGCWQIVALVRR